MKRFICAKCRAYAYDDCIENGKCWRCGYSKRVAQVRTEKGWVDVDLRAAEVIREWKEEGYDTVSFFRDRQDQPQVNPTRFEEIIFPNSSLHYGIDSEFEHAVDCVRFAIDAGYNF